MKKTCPNPKITIFLFALLFVFSFFNTALAADTMSLTATPVRLGDDFSIKLNPGEKKQVQVKLRNGSKESITLESGALDFTVADDGATPVVLDASEIDNKWSLASWLTLVPAQHTLKSEEVATVNVLIEVPKDALPGGHYAMIHHRPVNAAGLTESGSGISQRVGTLLYVIVNGPVNEEAYINRFDWPKFLENGPVNFALNIDNQSDIHINAKPVLKVYNMFGKQVADIELEAKNIFPKTERSFDGVWGKIWGLGYYKAVVEAPYGSQGQVMTAVSSLFLIPVKIILLILILTLITIIGFISLKKRKESLQKNSVDDLEINNEEPDDSEKKA
jgi:hypothetical protein